MISYDVRGKWQGVDGMGAELLQSMRPQAYALVKGAALLFETEIKKTLTGSRSGRRYRVSRTGKMHVASAPGEPPAVMFGKLRQSIGHSEPQWSGDTVASDVGPGAGINPAPPYARRMEFGGVDSRGTYIAPRPYMAPTTERVRPHIEAMFEAGI